MSRQSTYLNSNPIDKIGINICLNDSRGNRVSDLDCFLSGSPRPLREVTADVRSEVPVVVAA